MKFSISIGLQPLNQTPVIFETCGLQLTDTRYIQTVYPIIGWGFGLIRNPPTHYNSFVSGLTFGYTRSIPIGIISVHFDANRFKIRRRVLELHHFKL